MSKKKKEKLNDGFYSLEEEIKKELQYVNDGQDYSIGIDIANRSRELADLYIKVDEIDKAINILTLLIDFCHNMEPLNNGHFVSNDIEKLIELYNRKFDKKGIKNLLILMIERYPDYSNILYWEKLLSTFKK